jgi:hypothetical protein
MNVRVQADERAADGSEDPTEYVVKRVVSHGYDDVGEPIVRVRWAGYDDADDTWEPTRRMPREILEKYAKRLRVRVRDLLAEEVLD